MTLPHVGCESLLIALRSLIVRADISVIDHRIRCRCTSRKSDRNQHHQEHIDQAFHGGSPFL